MSVQPYQLDLDDARMGYKEYELQVALEDAIEAIRKRRAEQPPHNLAPEIEEQRALLNEALFDYGWRVSRIPNWRGPGH